MRFAVMEDMKQQVPLAVCVMLDVFGYFSYVIPVLGEWSDVVWAPVAAGIYWRLFGGKSGFTGATITLLEEVLPFTDVVPTFTITWLVKRKWLQPARSVLQR